MYAPPVGTEAPLSDPHVLDAVLSSSWLTLSCFYNTLVSELSHLSKLV